MLTTLPGSVAVRIICALSGDMVSRKSLNPNPNPKISPAPSSNPSQYEEDVLQVVLGGAESPKEVAFQDSIVALVALPGYFVAAALIGRMGPRRMQVTGIFCLIILCSSGWVKKKLELTKLQYMCQLHLVAGTTGGNDRSVPGSRLFLAELSHLTSPVYIGLRPHDVFARYLGLDENVSHVFGDFVTPCMR